MLGAMSAHAAATSLYFKGRVSNRDLYAQSRHLVEDDESDQEGKH
jgi:hypothetical protein